MKKIKRFGLVAFASSLFLCINAPFVSGYDYKTTTVYVTASALNIRQTTSTKLEKVDTVPYGTELQLIGKTKTENWSCIIYNEEIRFVCDKYISTEKPEQKKETINEAIYTPANFKHAGVIYWGNYRWTWYSEKILPGHGLKIPGRYTDSLGYVRDQNNYLCLASSDLKKGTIVNTPFGSDGKIYDCGCAHGTLDVYVGW